jgi:putative ABC transport system permease protein
VRLLSISLRNLRIRIVSTALTVTSIMVATGLYAGILVMAEQTQQRFSGFDASQVIVGPKDASQLEIVLNTIYNIGDAPALIPLKVAIDIREGREFGHRGQIRYAIPQARGDSVSRHAFPVIATIDEMFTKYERFREPLAFAKGRGFQFSWDDLRQLADGVAAHENGVRSGEGTPPPRPVLRPEWKQCVIGSRVARTLGLDLGGAIVPVHGKYGEFGTHEHTEAACEVVGILAPTNSPLDSSIFMPLGVHLLIGGHAKGSFVVPLLPGKNPEDMLKVPVQPYQIGLTAVLVDPKDPVGDQILRNAFMRRPDAQVAKPREQIPPFLKKIGNAADILQVIAWIVLCVAAIAIAVAIYNTMNERRREIAIMRSLGARRRQICTIIVAEASLLSSFGALLGVLLCHTAALLLRSTVEEMTGVYLDWTAFGAWELLLIAGVGVLGAIAGLLPAVKGSFTQVADNLAPSY